MNTKKGRLFDLPFFLVIKFIPENEIKRCANKYQNPDIYQKLHTKC
jgi:hypothetical protein